MCCFMRSCGAMGLKENVVYALGTLLHCRLKLLTSNEWFMFTNIDNWMYIVFGKRTYQALRHFSTCTY